MPNAAKKLPNRNLPVKLTPIRLAAFREWLRRFTPEELEALSREIWLLRNEQFKLMDGRIIGNPEKRRKQ